MGRFAVMGTGRSGTAWTARVLRQMGLRVGGESVFDWQDDSGSEERWADLDGDVSLGCIGWPHLLPETRPLIVRHPLKVTQSFHDLRFWHRVCECHAPSAHLGTPYAQFFMKLIPEIQECNNTLDRNITYQVRWIENGLALATSIWSLEDLLRRPEALALLGAECGAEISVSRAIEIQAACGVTNDAEYRKVPAEQRDVVSLGDIFRRPLGPALVDLWNDCDRLSRSKSL